MSQPSPTTHTTDSATESILLAETDLLFTVRIVSAAERAGYTVAIARSAHAAIERLRTKPVALVILNLSSPRLGGLDLVRTIKQRFPEVRVLAYMSHVHMPEVRDDARAAGVDKLCANSAVSLRLPDLVRDALAGAGSRQEE